MSIEQNQYQGEDDVEFTDAISDESNKESPVQEATPQVQAAPKGGKASQKRRTNFEGLGKQICCLVKMLEDGTRRSIHQPMRDAIASIEILYKKVAIQLKDEGAKELADKFAQTSPLFKAADRKRKQEDGTLTSSNPKRRQGQQKEQQQRETPKDTPKDTPKNRHPKTTPRSNPGGKRPAASSEWRKVISKKAGKEAKKAVKKSEKKAQRLEKARADAIVIQSQPEGLSYAEILRKVKSDPALKAVGEAVTGIRRTQKGELLLRLKETGDMATELTSSISAALGQTATVKTLTHRITIECRDIDEITTKEEICEAIKKQAGLDGILVTDIVSLRKAYGGMQAASVSLPAKWAKSLLEAGKIKIGWSVCRFRVRTTLTRCFKCLEFGHISRQCTSKEDRAKLCRKCGGEGHIAKDCKEEPSCMFCRRDHPERAKHVAGSGVCPVFRRALSQKKR